MNETLLRNWVRKMLLEQKAYEPACQYEVDVNYRLAAAGARSSYTPPPEPNFCVGTDTGGDAEFNAIGPEGRLVTYNLELKAGSGNKRGENPGFSHPAGQALLEGIEKFNNVSHVSRIVTEDLARRTGNGILVDGDYDEVPPESINKIAQFIVDSQQTSIDSHLRADVPPETKMLRVYYYFGRTGRAEKELDIPVPFDLSKPDESLIGTFEQRYSKSNTHYIQIENAGLFYMVNDPLGLEEIGVKNFSGNMKTSARFRVESGGGKRYKDWKQITVPAIKDGAPTTVTCNVRTKDFYIYVTEDLNVSSKTQSGLNLDNPADLAKFAEFIQTPPPMEESMSESMLRKLVSQVLLESTAGHEYEENLINSFNANAQNSWCVLKPAPNLTYDIGVVDKVSGATRAKIEVKLDKNAQLGKISKDTFSSLKYIVGGQIVFEFAEGIDESNIDIVKTIMAFINSPKSVVLNKLNAFFTTAANVLVDKQPMVVRPGAVIDLTKTILIPLEIDPNKARAKKGYTVSPARDAQGNVVPKQFSSFKTGVKFTSDQMINYLAKKKNYFILGDGGTGPVGGICSIASDPLNLGLNPITLGDVAVEIRWKDSGPGSIREVDGITYKGNTFTFESRGGNVSAAAGKRFESGQDLVAIFNPPPAAPASTSEDL